MAFVIVEMNEMFPEVMLDITANMFTSDIWSLIRACKSFRYVGPMASTVKVQCTSATTMTIATGTSKMKDEAVEYLASGELRLDSSFGYLNFDDVCYLEAISTDEFGVPQPLDLDEVLYHWEDMEVSDNHAARADPRPPPERLGFPDLTGRFGQSKEISVLAAVANRYRGGGTVAFTSTNLPQKRCKIAAWLTRAFHLIRLSEFTAAALMLSYVLKLDPDNVHANFQLGMIHLHEFHTTEDMRLGLGLLHSAGMQGHFLAAFEAGCAYSDCGEWLEARRSFEAALRSNRAGRYERAAVAYKLGFVCLEQGDDDGCEAYFLRARNEGCSDAPYNLGMMYLDKGRSIEAHQMLQEALYGDAGRDAFHALNCFYEARGDPEETLLRYAVKTRM